MDAGEVQLFNDRQRILREGIENNSFYLVLQGEVSVMKERTKIRNLGEGECIGEMSYLSQEKTTAGIVAKGEVMICSVTPGLIERLSYKSQLGFQDAFIEVIDQRLTRSTSYIKQLQKIISKVKKTKINYHINYDCL